MGIDLGAAGNRQAASKAISRCFDQGLIVGSRPWKGDHLFLLGCVRWLAGFVAARHEESMKG